MEGGKIVINERLLSIPPRLSVSWREVSSLYQKSESLHIVLKGGEQIVVDDLEAELLDTIFHHHALFLEKRAEERHREMLGPAGLAKWAPPFAEGGETMMKIGLPPLDAMGMMVEHNPEQKDAPPLPADLLEKVSGVIRLLTDDPEGLPKPEGDCQCFHCQIARALHPASEKVEVIEPLDEVISMDDLMFSDWEVEDAGEKLFKVKNKLDPEESYSVFLGSPVGCTCGRLNCEHVVAVLKS